MQDSREIKFAKDNKEQLMFAPEIWRPARQTSSGFFFFTSLCSNTLKGVRSK